MAASSSPRRHSRSTSTVSSRSWSSRGHHQPWLRRRRNFSISSASSGSQKGYRRTASGPSSSGRSTAAASSCSSLTSTLRIGVAEILSDSFNGQFGRFGPVQRRMRAIPQNIEAVEPMKKLDRVRDALSSVDDDSGHISFRAERKLVWQVRHSVVGLSSYIGRTRIHVCSGFVVDSSENFAKILTSASLLKDPNSAAVCPEGLKVKVYLPDGNIVDGDISCLDLHYNLAIVYVKEGAALKPLIFNEEEDIALEGEVMALGCNYDTGNLMSTHGDILISVFHELGGLLGTSCKIPKYVLGGPTVNYRGHVLGITLHKDDKGHSFYLPIAVALRCFTHKEKFSKVVRPWLGIIAKSPYAVPLSMVEESYNTISDISTGLFLILVANNSPAYNAGMRRGDVIMECCGKTLHSVPELAIVLLDASEEFMKAGVEHRGDGKGDEIPIPVVYIRDGERVTANCIAKEMNPTAFTKLFL